MDTAGALLTDNGIAQLLLSVGYDASENPAGSLPSETLESLLLMLCNCGTQGRSTARPDTIVELHRLVLALRECDDERVSQLAAQGALMFE